MATVRVVDLISRALTLLQDPNAVRWPVLELQQWLNDSYREIMALRPDANSVTGQFTCASGPRQVLTTQFSEAFALLDVLRNLGDSSKGRAVRAVARKVLDDQFPDWYTERETENIEFYVPVPSQRKEFLVYPPAKDTAVLEVVYAVLPTAHSMSEAQLLNPESTDTINLDDGYANAMLDYMLFRAYSKDTDAGNSERAVLYRQSMVSSLTSKTT